MSATSIKYRIWKRQRAIAAAFLSLSMVAVCHADTGQPYDPRHEGQWVTYQRYNMGATWNPDTKQLSIAWRNVDSANPVITVKYTNAVPCPSITPNQLYQSPRYAGTIADANLGVPIGALYDAIGTYQAYGYCIGEVGDPLHGLTVTPAEPKLPFNISGSEHYEIDCQVADSRSGRTVNYIMHTSFWTIGHYANWGPYNDCWRTTLVEYNGANIQSIYNYVFARGIGLIDFWWGGAPDVQGNVAGTEMYATAWGQN
jgi:hypothetical protein